MGAGDPTRRKRQIVTLLASALLVGGCIADFDDHQSDEDGGVGADGGLQDATPGCGNGQLDTWEVCDGVHLGGASCEDLGFIGGTLACSSVCQHDTAGCFSEDCGNAQLDPGEQCDGDLFGGSTCQSQGYAGGTLACTTGCLLDVSLCWWCGNGLVDDSEDCEGSDLSGQTCVSLGYDDGTLACDATCQFDTSACHSCGDGVRDPGEECDGTDFGTNTCQTLGWTAGGFLSCTSSCTRNTSGCIACSPSNCASGCCEDSMTCRPGDNHWFCGDSGEACDDCTIAGTCCDNGGDRFCAIGSCP